LDPLLASPRRLAYSAAGFLAEPRQIQSESCEPRLAVVLLKLTSGPVSRVKPVGIF